MGTTTAEATISAVEAAQRLKVSRSTIYNWLTEGLLPGAWQIAPGKGWRIPESAVTSLL